MAEPAGLTELERDALTELVNIGVSRAAAALRQMVHREVLLSVPSIEMISQREASALIGEREAGEMVAVRQDFTGAFSGRALLIFPQAHSRELVQVVVGDEVTPEELAAMQQEALAEIGNVILNGCLGTMANMLKQSLTMTLPAVFYARGSQLFSQSDEPAREGPVLFLYINFAILGRDIRGYIAMVLDLASVTALKELVTQFISSVMNDGADLA